MKQLFGREAEIAELIRRLDAAIGGMGGAVVFVGDAGVGKSSLLDEVARRYAGSMTVLRATGVEDEMGLTWSGLASLIRPLTSTVDYAELTPSRRRVLDASLFLAEDPEGDTAIEPYSVSLALLDLVTHAALRRPLLVLIDDMHWMDTPSARALAYLARRLDREYVALVATSRPPPFDTSLPRVALKPPSIDDADGILRQRSVSSAAVRAVLIDSVGTNPLMLANSVAELHPDVLRGRRPIPDPLPFPKTVMDGAERRLEALDAETREALRAIAVLGQPTLRDAQQIVSAIGSGLQAIEGAERAGIVEIGEHVKFSHPKLRTAAYQSSTAPDRRRLHRLAADVTGQSSIAKAMHLAAATVAADEAVAVALSEASEQLTHRGALAVAAEQFVRAAQLSTEPTAAAARRLRAAELFLDLGLLEQARPLLDAIADVIGDNSQARERAAVARARARLLHLEERDDEACALLRESASALNGDAPADAARLLLECLAPLVREARLSDVIEVVGELQALRPRIEGHLASRVDATSSVFAMLGALPGAGGLDEIEALLGDEGLLHAAPFLAEVIAPVLAFARRDEALGTMLDNAERVLREHAAIVPLISVLAAQQLRNFGVRQPLAIEAGEEAIRLAHEIGRPKLAMMAAIGLSVSSAIAGDAVAYKLASDLLSTSTYPHAQTTRLVGLGVLHLSAGRFEQSAAIWEGLVSTRGFGDPLLTWEADYLETLTRLGRMAEARDLIARFDEQGLSRRTPATFDRVRGIVGTDDTAAAEAFQRSVEVFQAARNRIGEGRAELCWGERLRRRRRKAEARTHLERALELFRAVGVPGWAARAEGELVASGAVVDSALPVHALLTSQELRVARLVAGGASNRDIGVELFLSERTVESHLTVIFRKLQIKNRRELAARSVTDPALRPQKH